MINISSDIFSWGIFVQYVLIVGSVNAAYRVRGKSDELHI
jgi:hypothetical protein